MTGAAHLFVGRTMARPELLPFAGGEVLVFTAAAPGRAGPNEDAALVYLLGPDRGVLAVADGAGGHPGAGRAARSAVEALAVALREAASGTTLREAVLEGFDRANAAVAALGGGATSTLAAATVAAGEVRAFHVGDSPILVVGGGGRVKLQTIDHSPVGYAVAAGVLAREEALHHAERHLLSNHLGSPAMRVDVSSPLALAPRDRLLLASDGLHDNLYTAEIAALLRRGALAGAGAALVALARERMAGAPTGSTPSKPDDLTLLVYRSGRRLSR